MYLMALHRCAEEYRDESREAEINRSSGGFESLAIYTIGSWAKPQRGCLWDREILMV